MLECIHKNKVKAIIRKNGIWKGAIAPSNVNSFHVLNGWHIGMRVAFTTLEEMEKTVSQFAWYNCVPELGM